MRICLVSRELEPFFGAGIGVYAAAAARAWAAAGHEVHVVTEGHAGLAWEGNQTEPPAEAGGPVGTPDDGSLERDGRDRTGDGSARGGLGDVEGFEGIEVYVAAEVEREDLPHFHLRHALGVVRKVRALHAAKPFDYVEFADYFAEGAFALHGRRRGRGGDRLKGAVLGVRLHTPSIECWAINEERELPIESAELGPLEYRAISGADVLISPSRALLDRVNATLDVRGLKQPLGHVVAYPFDAGAVEFQVRNKRDRKPGEGAGERPTVLCFGRLERRKGVHVLAEAAVEMLERGSNARFEFVGGDTNTGPGQSSMREHVLSLIPEKWRERISVELSLSRDEVLKRVRSSEVCCFPAIWDNFPNALLEAMAMGKPIVATSGSGLGEMIEDGRSGLLVEPGEAGALASVLGRVLPDGGLRARLGEGARARVGQLCDPAGVTGQMEAVIRGVELSMRRDRGCWRELAPAAESRTILERARLSVKRRLGRGLES